VLSGEAQVLVQKDGGLRWQTLRRGEFIQISGGTKQAWRNVSHEPMEAFVTAAERPLAELSERYGYWIGSPEENAEVGISLIQ
jgi:quercetin dioxygenase-like cupin family protein